MKITSTLFQLMPLASAAHFPKAMYDAGEVHQTIMDIKMVSMKPGHLL
jgi:hypothetical protein